MKGKWVTIEINCDNAAFGDNEWEEVARILRALADDLEVYRNSDLNKKLSDFNGNVVGDIKTRGF